MKGCLRLFFLCMISFGFSDCVRAQGETQNLTGGFWKTKGNSGTNPASNFVGTTDAVGLAIRTNNTDRIRVLSTGNIGMGTAVPTEILHVAGNLRIDNAFMPGNNAGTAGQVLSSQGAGVAPTWINLGSLVPLGSFSISNNENLPDNFTSSCSDSTAFADFTPRAINDLSTLNVTIPVSGLPTTLCAVTVTLNITHTWDADLDISLTSPLGTVIDLSSDNGGSGDNFVKTVFDDNAPTLITAGVPPFTGSFRPETPLSNLNGENPNGNWTLTIVDDLAADVGTLEDVTIKIFTPVAGSFSFVGETTVPIVAGEAVNVDCDYSVKSNSSSGITIMVSRDVVSGSGSIGTVLGYCADSSPSGAYKACGISDRDAGLANGTYYYKLWEFVPNSVIGTRNYSLVVNKTY